MPNNVEVFCANEQCPQYQAPVSVQQQEIMIADDGGATRVDHHTAHEVQALCGFCGSPCRLVHP